MSEKSPQLPNELQNFDRIEAQVAKDGSRRMYGVDADGKKRQLKGDNVLESYGYSIEDAQLNNNNSDQSIEVDSYEAYSDKLTSAVLNSKVDSDGTIQDSEYLSPVVAKATQRGLLGESGKDLLLDEYKRQTDTSDLDNPYEVLAAKQKEADVRASMPNSLYEDLFLDSGNESSQSNEFEGLDAEELADEKAYALITNDSDAQKLINTELDKHLEGLTDSEAKQERARITGLVQEKQFDYLVRLDDMKELMSDEQYEYALGMKKHETEMLELFMEKLTKEQAQAILGGDELAADQIEDQFNKVFAKYKQLNNLTDEESKDYRDKLGEQVFKKNAQEADASDEQAKHIDEDAQEKDNTDYEGKHLKTKESVKNKIGNRWKRIKAGFYALPANAKLALSEMRGKKGEEERNKWIKRGLIGATAVGAAGVVALVSNKSGIDLDPGIFDGDGLDLNPFNNSPDSSEGVGDLLGDVEFNDQESTATARPGVPTPSGDLEASVVSDVLEVKPEEGFENSLQDQYGLTDLEAHEAFKAMENNLVDAPGAYLKNGDVRIASPGNFQLPSEARENLENYLKSIGKL